MTEPATGDFVDIGQQIDDGAWTGVQRQVVIFAILAIVIDGIDNQLLALVLPSMMKEWHVTRGDFSPVFALGLIGMSGGTALAGFLGDRLGRKTALLVSVVLFGLVTLATSKVHSLHSLYWLRMLAGIGIGGALPNATALIAEFVPMAGRSIAITAGILGGSTGGLIGGFVASSILTDDNWRVLFIGGGGVALIFAVVIAIALPESPRFLVGRPGRKKELLQLLHRLGIPSPAGATLLDGTERSARGSLATVFTRQYRRDTIALWGACFFTVLTGYMALNWAPSLLAGMGFDLSATSAGLAAFNFGGIFGSIVIGVLIGRFGSRWPSLGTLTMTALWAAFLAAAHVLDPHNRLVMVAAFATGGFFSNGGITALYVTALHTYPTRMRTTGVGSTIAFGRIGAILSSYAGPAILAAGGASGYFALLSAMMIAAAIFLFFLRHHVPRPAR
jgi:AAHS family 4-hydroxybenzoate transporter-like MFS transporter